MFIRSGAILCVFLKFRIYISFLFVYDYLYLSIWLVTYVYMHVEMELYVIYGTEFMQINKWRQLSNSVHLINIDTIL